MATAEVFPIDKPANWAGPDSYMISTEDLWKTYDMGSEQVHALRGINLRIQRNEYVAIMGPSGSGKSTLMNLIGCLDSPSKGQYWLNGQLVSELDDDELARIRNKKAEFVAVETGISGTTDIEVTKGLHECDEVITGSYKVLRTVKPGTSVKIDNSAPKKEDESS